MEFGALLDWHTSPVLAKHGVHGDVLSLTVRKPLDGGRTKVLGYYELATQTGEHNTARFGWR